MAGFEPYLKGRPVHDLLCMKRNNAADALVGSMASVAGTVGIIPTVRVCLLEGNVSDDVSECELEEVTMGELVSALQTGRRGKFVLKGPYLFQFSPIKVRLFQPRPMLEGGEAVGYFRTAAFLADSASAARAMASDWAALDGGYIADFGEVAVAHPDWAELEPTRLMETPVFSTGRAYFGA